MTNYTYPYLANVSTKEFHKLSNEKPQCQLIEIISAGHDKGYLTKDSAKHDGYDPCDHCMTGESTR